MKWPGILLPSLTPHGKLFCVAIIWVVTQSSWEGLPDAEAHHPNLQSPKNLERSKYDYLMKTFKPISKEVGNDILDVSNDEIKPVSEMNDNQKLVFSTILFVKRSLVQTDYLDDQEKLLLLKQ